MSQDAQLARAIAMLEQQGEDIAEIKRDVKAQNGRVGKLEMAHERLKVYGFMALVALGIGVDWIKHKLGLS
jgi:hypothetical protein